MNEINELPIADLDVFAPFTINGMGFSQGEITTSLEEVVDTLLASGADPDKISVEVLASSIGRSALPRISSEQSLQTMAEIAANNALIEAGVEPASVNGLIFATSTAPLWAPDPSKALHRNLGLSIDCQSYTMVDACQSGLDGLVEAAYKVNIQPGMDRILVVAAEVLSPRLNPKDGPTNAIFSDTSAAVLIERDDSGKAGLVLDAVVTDSKYVNALTLGPQPNPVKEGDQMFMNPKEVGGSIASLCRQAVKKAITQGHPLLIERNRGVETYSEMVKADLARLVVNATHQPSQPMFEGIEKRLNLDGGVPEGITPYYFDKIGNSSSPTLLRALYEILHNEGAANEIKPGDNIGYFGAGIGATARFGVLRR